MEITMKRALHALAVLLLLAIAAAATNNKECHGGDYAALVAVKAAFSNASYFASWTPGTSCCDWNGINCDHTGHVISLAILQDDNVVGFIPGDAIAGLTHLEALTFFHVPGVHGAIPPALAGLSSLMEITITWTGVSGHVPSFLGALTKLKWVDLSFNWLTGAIPPSLGAGERLVSVVLSGNRLTGGIPAEVAKLGHLKFFNVSYNMLCGEVAGNMVARFGLSSFQHNKCLCGALLPPCH